MERLLGCETDRARGLIRFEGREVSVGVHPVGVPASQIEEFASGAPQREDGIREVVGVDRLDYTKGIVERLEAVERLLERHPEHRGCIVFTQVAVPSAVAERLGLARGAPIVISTANGRATGHRTRLASLRLGDIELRDVAALIAPGMDGDEVLLGMSALQQLEFSQKGGTLVLRQSTLQ